ncbi:P-type ATPase, cytoplasmic domain N-containing protein [Russula decolorans]
MANASVICTDKTGTLTQNKMAVVPGSIDIHAKFVWQLDENPARAGNEDTSRPNAKDSTLVELLNASIAINSTTFEDVDSESGDTVFIGSKTETALLKHTRRRRHRFLMIPFSSERKSMGCVVRLPNVVHRLFMKGASEILTEMHAPCDCTSRWGERRSGRYRS